MIALIGARAILYNNILHDVQELRTRLFILNYCLGGRNCYFMLNIALLWCCRSEVGVSQCLQLGGESSHASLVHQWPGAAVARGAVSLHHAEVLNQTARIMQADLLRI